jgi:hypothetical protein
MSEPMVTALDPTSQVSAASITQRFPISSNARLLLDESGGNLRRFLDELLARGMPADALVVMARILPKRYVIAWACECLNSTFARDPKTADVDRAGLALAQQWLSDPTEERRRAASEFAESGEFKTPGAWIAASAGWSGGSLAPRGYDAIVPPDHLPAEAAVAALRLTASRSPEYATVVSGFVARGLQVFGPSGR